MKYLISIGDAASQLLNALIGGHANESLSGRAHRTGSKWEDPIDKLFFILFKQVDHCRKAYQNDVVYAEKLLKQHQDRESGFFTPKD